MIFPQDFALSLVKILRALIMLINNTCKAHRFSNYMKIQDSLN